MAIMAARTAVVNRASHEHFFGQGVIIRQAFEESSVGLIGVQPFFQPLVVGWRYGAYHAQIYEAGYVTVVVHVI